MSKNLSTCFLLGMLGCQTPTQLRLKAHCDEEPMSPSNYTFQQGDAAFFILQSCTICPANSNQTPQTFYVKGHMDRSRFVPESQVMGEGSLELQTGTPGWLELDTGHFYPMQTARAPVSPYIKGNMTTQGFIPANRQVH